MQIEDLGRRFSTCVAVLISLLIFAAFWVEIKGMWESNYSLIWLLFLLCVLAIKTMLVSVTERLNKK